MFRAAVKLDMQGDQPWTERRREGGRGERIGQGHKLTILTIIIS